MSDLIERLRICAGMLVAFGSDAALLQEASNRIQALEREIEHLKEALAATDYARLKATYGSANARQEPRTQAAMSQTRAE